MRVCVLWAAFAVGGVVGCGNGGSGGGPAPDAASTVQEGQIAVAFRRCASCHQSPNPADGVLSGQTTPVPGTQSYGSNLTPDPDTGMDAWDAGAIASAILAGVDPQGRTLCPAMPHGQDAGMSEDEALSIALYLQTLTPVWHLVPASACGTNDAGVDARP